MPYAVWTFLCCPDGLVERYPGKRYDRVFAGKEPVGRDVGDEAHFVELAIETRGGHPLRVIQVWYPRYEIGPEGFVSADHQKRRMYDAVQMIDVGPADEKIVPLEPRLARSRVAQEHSWQPTAAELQAIVAAINYAAAKELACTDGQRLMPT
jgi:hypothetical protein